jgi:hypothetical protein
MNDANGVSPSWRQLKPIQLGKYAEYYAKMEAIRLGYDVYTAEVDNKGIDFVLRKDRTTYCDVQVKSIRWPSSKYVFMQKSKFELRENFLLFLVLFEEHKWPRLYSIPATVWRTPHGMFVSKDYAGLKSKPEYGVQLSVKTRSTLEQYKFGSV